MVMMVMMRRRRRMAMIFADNNADFDNANYRYTLSLINMLLIREWFMVLKCSQYSRESVHPLVPKLQEIWMLGQRPQPIVNWCKFGGFSILGALHKKFSLLLKHVCLKDVAASCEGTSWPLPDAIIRNPEGAICHVSKLLLGGITFPRSGKGGPNATFPPRNEA